jgi:hypothetical protein
MSRPRVDQKKLEHGKWSKVLLGLQYHMLGQMYSTTAHLFCPPDTLLHFHKKLTRVHELHKRWQPDLGREAACIFKNA